MTAAASAWGTPLPPNAGRHPEPPRLQHDALLAFWNAQRERHAERFRAIPGARVVMLEGAGHALWIQRKDEVAPLMREFLVEP